MEEIKKNKMKTQCYIKGKHKVYIWGAGYYSDFVYSVIDKENCTVEGIVDSALEKQGMDWKYGLHIFPPEILNAAEFDYVFISPQKYDGIEKQCKAMNIPGQKIIIYWKDSEADGLYQNRSESVIKYRNRALNAPYEWGMKTEPFSQIRSAEECLKRILKEKCSLCRYGDGEFGIILHCDRLWYQKTEPRLEKRLREILLSKHSDVLIAIADNFGNLERYKENAADDIREWIVPNRDKISALLRTDSDYYDAYVSRPYIIYRDNKYAVKIFRLFKEIWKGRDVLLVEGKRARSGVNNDLLKGAARIRRIECPEKNAWDSYGDILKKVREVANQDTLICVSLGPTATVLAYDLAESGYQALDIGQLDNEYEWFLRGTEKRIPIPGKMVAEVEKGRCREERMEISEEDEKRYAEQIVASIG